MLQIMNEAARCLLCGDACCTKNCPEGFRPDRMVRAVRFENEKGAASFVESAKCAECSAPCEKSCIHYDFPIRIKQIAAALSETVEEPDYKNLETDFLGVHCENPFFLSSSVVASGYEMCARALDMG
ncbi:MAG: hypothetical protein Q4F84_09285, partial [Fibrobacter sp.]|nr:hypothetical protein [Fibrobacter sp.]